MRITSLEIERFGVWENLYLPKIRRGINVFYGPNEAGKTTLMQFIRSSLYGSSNPDRARYIQMDLYPRAESPFAQNRISPTEMAETEKSGNEQGTPDETKWIGGVMTVQDEYGTHRLERRYVRKSASSLYGATPLEAKAGFVVSGGLAAWSGRFFPIPGTGIAESLIISGDDGARLSDHFIQSIVSNVDESTFNNVFAIGLDELQRLGTLDETDAAQMLYRLSVGMDRVSLIQILHQMVEERNEIFDIKGKPAILDALLARRGALSQKALSASANLREYTELRNEQIEAEEVLRQLEEKLAVHGRQRQIYEIAARVAPVWDERADLRIRLAEYGTVTAVDSDAVREADGKVAAIADVRKSLAALGNQYKQVRKNLKNTDYNRSVWKNASLIDMLMTEIPHLESINQKVSSVQSEIAAVQKELDQEEQRLRGARNGKILLTSSVLKSMTDPATGLPAKEIPDADAEAVSAGAAAAPEMREIDDYRGPARAVIAARRRYLKARDLFRESGERLKAMTAELDRELSSRGQKNLDEAITENGQLTTQLRRRLEIGKRMSDCDKVKRELTRQNGYLVANQSLPYPVTIAIGVGVALGGLLAVFAFLGKGPFDPSVGIFGVLLAFAVLFYKTTFERKNYAKLEENQRQLAAVMKRYDQIKAEAAVIDQKYPAPGQTVESRIQKAEADQGVFERLLPLDTRLKEAVHRQKVLEKRLKTAKAALAAARHRWIAWLKAAGLAVTLKPSHVKGMLQRVDFADALRRKIETKKNLLDVHIRERKSITDRIGYLMAETGTPALLNSTPAEQIEYLHELLEQVRETRKIRSEEAKKLSGFRKERNKIQTKIHRMNVDLDDFLSLFDAKSVDRLKELALRCREHNDLLAKFQTAEEKLESGIGGFCDESEIADVLNDEKTREKLPALTSALNERIAKLTDDKKEKTLLIGRLSEQLSNLAAQRDFVGFQFESAQTDRRIGEMAKLWQSRAAACKMMEDIRKAYEKERQPETLKEASRLLCRLTDGLYVKIWTPLGEDTLYVDTNEGETLDIGSLSRGTREQLFIAIRLALAVSFEKHGINLPLILDDVLVNFDNHRAAAAADVLREFAEAGRQIFLFTCHRHICSTFLKLDRPVFVLPDKTTKVKQFRVILPKSMDKLPDEEEEDLKSLPTVPASAGEPNVISPVTVPPAVKETEEVPEEIPESTEEFSSSEENPISVIPEEEVDIEGNPKDDWFTYRNAVGLNNGFRAESEAVPVTGSEFESEEDELEEESEGEDPAAPDWDEDSDERWIEGIEEDDSEDGDFDEEDSEPDDSEDGDFDEEDSELDDSEGGDFDEEDSEPDDSEGGDFDEEDSELDDSEDGDFGNLDVDGADEYAEEGFDGSSEVEEEPDNDLTSEELKTSDGYPAEIDSEEDESEELEESAVPVDLLPDDGGDSEEEPEVKPFQFSTWKDFVRFDEKSEEPAPHEKENGEEEDEESDNEFVRRYFTRESKNDFFEDEDESGMI